jgi:hypothetical protein
MPDCIASHSGPMSEAEHRWTVADSWCCSFSIFTWGRSAGPAGLSDLCAGG